MFRLEDSKNEGAKKSRNTYHIWGVAFRGYNDLIFRRRLFLTNWRSRFRVLAEYKSTLENSPGNFESNFDSKWASLKRDWLLLYGSDEEIQRQLILECKHFPLNQTPRYHERYALCAELLREIQGHPEIQARHFLERTSSELLYEKLAEQYSVLEQVPDVTYWSSYKVQFEREGQIKTVTFLAPNSQAAELFVSELNQAEKDLKIKNLLNKTQWGFRAMKFFPTDPHLQDAENKIKEASIQNEIEQLHVKRRAGMIPEDSYERHPLMDQLFVQVGSR